MKGDVMFVGLLVLRAEHCSSSFAGYLCRRSAMMYEN
jgi:hypothetical protein